MQNDKLILFDFCETLIKFQTADRYVHYCRKKMGTKRMLFFQSLTILLERIKFFKLYNRFVCGNNLHKRLILYQLKGVEKSVCEELAKGYFEEELLPNIIPETIGLLKKHQESNAPIWLISGGYDLYIKFFVEYFQIDGYICSHIKFDKEDVCSGRMEGLDCMRYNKNQLLDSFLKRHPEISDITVYSDSLSDLPILLRANNAVVISREKHQDWIDQYHLNEIIWT